LAATLEAVGIAASVLRRVDVGVPVGRCELAEDGGVWTGRSAEFGRVGGTGGIVVPVSKVRTNSHSAFPLWVYRVWSW
jgi:hypothetical protein